MKTYVLGFLFDRQGNVALVRKKGGPGGQRGKLNGFGGKLRAFEEPIDGIAREFREESGITDALVWHPIDGLFGSEWRVHCFAAEMHPFPAKWTGTEDVEVHQRPTRPNSRGRYVTGARVAIERGARRLGLGR